MNTITLTIPAELADDIKKQIEAFEAEQKPKPWLQNGDKYWFIGAEGEVDTYSWNGDSVDQGLWGCGNIFRTKEEAESVANRRKAQAKIDNYIREQGIENGFVAGVYNWVVYFNHNKGCPTYDVWEKTEVCSPFHVRTEEIAKQIIDAVGPETVEMAIRGRVG